MKINNLPIEEKVGFFELDEDGYPNPKALKIIETWDVEKDGDYKFLMELIEDIWLYAKSGNTAWVEEDGYFYISTCGWSGNEEIIGALQKNTVFWLMCWCSSERGGHYKFKI